MKAGDLVQGDFESLYHGIVMAFQKEEYAIIKWLDTGESVCYHLPDEDIESHIEVISESR